MTIKLRLDIFFFNDIQIGVRNSVLPTVRYVGVINTSPLDSENFTELCDVNCVSREMCQSVKYQ
jgi:hypothetical protein